MSPPLVVPTFVKLVGRYTRILLVVLSKIRHLYLRVGTHVGALLVSLGAHILYVEEPILVMVVFIYFLKVVPKFHVPLLTHQDGDVTQPR